MLSEISRESLLAEQQITDELFNHISEQENLVFDAGAGSGKTHALVECLRHIVGSNGRRLRARGQSVACITFTNVAADEIRERLGRSDVVTISTIHGFLWPMMSPFQEDLVAMHRDKLLEEIGIMEAKLRSDDFEAYARLSKRDQAHFEDSIVSAKTEFYAARNLRAKEFRATMETALPSIPFLGDLLRNCEKFKAIAGNIIRISDYTRCVSSIDGKEEGFSQALYDPTRNRDSLARMLFSHDTLLEYGLELARRNSGFRRLMVNRHPFVLVDEYQDTNEDVVLLLAELSKEAASLQREFFVGYFGDSAQSIYDSGVGERLPELCKGLAVVTKPHNRRSCCEIIEVGNKIRNDGIKQTSIFDDCAGGSVEFFAPGGTAPLDNDAVRSFIAKTASDFGVSSEQPLHCLVLTNEMAAHLAGFGNLFERVKKTDYFKTHYDMLREEFVASNPEKLNPATRLLFNLCSMRRAIEDNSTALSDFGINNSPGDPGYTFGILNKAVDSLRSITPKSPGDYVDEIARIEDAIYGDGCRSLTHKLIEGSLGFSPVNMQSVAHRLVDILFPHADPDNMSEERLAIEEILRVSFDEYDAWYDFVRGETDSPIHYHTYHSAKGDEYDNVLIIGGSRFGRAAGNIFELFFSQYGNEPEDSNLKKKYRMASNMLYVATTRAIKRLRVLYIDDVKPFASNVEFIFGAIEYI